MIKLNTERSIIRIEKVEDITSLPGFVTQIDPKKDGHKLKDIIGNYDFDDEVRCGLACNQPHNRGFVAVTDKGAVILLGNRCGKRTFGVEFKIARAAFVRDINAKERRETIQRAKHQLPELRQRVQAIRDAGATRYYALGQAIRGPEATAPGSVRRTLDELLRTGRTVVMGTRSATEAEKEAYEATQGRRPPPGYAVQVELGRLAGLGYFSPDLDLRRLLIDEVEATLAAVESIDLDSASHRQLADTARAANQLTANFDRIQVAMEYATAFFTRENLAPLRRIIRGQYEKQALEAFMDALPR